MLAKTTIGRLMMPRRWVTAIGAVVASCAALVVADLAAKREYGRPQRRDPALRPNAIPDDATDAEIPAVDGTALRGWLREAQSGRTGPAALVIHGWGGTANDMLPVSEVLLGLGMHVLLLDARGHGRSDDCAVCSMPSFADDVRAGLAWMRSAPQVDSSRILLVGHSVGAGACLFVASEDTEIAAVISLASMADPSAFMAQRLDRYMPRAMTKLVLRYVEHTIRHRFTEFAPVSTIARIKTPVLLLHGRRDSTVPVSDAYLLRERASSGATLVVVPDGDHFSIDSLETTRTDLIHFLRSSGLIAPTVAPLMAPATPDSDT